MYRGVFCINLHFRKGDMSEQIDQTIFSDLKSCDPREVAVRTGCRWDSDQDHYIITVWGHSYCVDLQNNAIRPQGTGLNAYHEYLDLFILYYLLTSKSIPPSGEWVSEKDIPGGAAFFRGPHTVPTNWITGRFGDDLDLFKQASENLSGIPVDMADAAYMFSITPTIPVAVLYWVGDEDFPSEAKLLFDRTIAQQLPLDIIYALSAQICHTLGKGLL